MKKAQMSLGIAMVGIFLIVFWTVLPFSMKYLYSNQYSELSQDTYSQVRNSGTFGGLIAGVSIWFKFLFLTIPGIPVAFTFFMDIMLLITLLFLMAIFTEIITGVLKLIPH